ncbi:restriction endonuclease subunit S [Acinetobacter haemolyticus]|uniref:restriction endonuclease subunit S n=1 Tax=Acinetobacter haemolyticus TaxID=29430 RepID=UPI0034CE645E
MTSFQEMTFSELLSDAEVFVDGDWVESKDQDPNGDVRLIQLADIGDGFYIDKSSRFLNSETAKRLKCTYLKEGDILVARMPNPLGRACIFPKSDMPCVTVVDVCIIRPNQNKVDNRWLMHTINSPVMRQRINEYVTGTTRQRISRGNFSKLKISVPPLAEQRRIASILDQADELRQKRQQAIEKLDQLLQATFIDMFGDPVKNSRNIKETSLYEIAKIYTGKTPPSSKENMFNGEIPFITPGDLGNIITKSKRSLTLEGGAYSQIVPIGSTLVCCIGATIGKIGYASISCSFNQQINSITWGSQINPIFGYEMLKFYSGLISVKGASTTLPILKKSEFEKIKVIVPEMDSQIKFEEIAKLIWQQTEIQKSALNENKSLLNSLQQKAFNGTL